MPPPVKTCELWAELSNDEKAVLDAEAVKAGYTDTMKWIIDKWCRPGMDQVMRRYIIENLTHCNHLLQLVPPSTVLQVEHELEQAAP
jgi:hypothetical protein